MSSKFLKTSQEVAGGTLVGEQVVFMIPYLTVQFVAVGNGLSYFIDISYGGAILVFSLFLIAGIFIGNALFFVFISEIKLSNFIDLTTGEC